MEQKTERKQLCAFSRARNDDARLDAKRLATHRLLVGVWRQGGGGVWRLVDAGVECGWSGCGDGVVRVWSLGGGGVETGWRKVVGQNVGGATIR